MYMYREKARGNSLNSFCIISINLKIFDVTKKFFKYTYLKKHMRDSMWKMPGSSHSYSSTLRSRQGAPLPTGQEGWTVRLDMPTQRPLTPFWSTLHIPRTLEFATI